LARVSIQILRCDNQDVESKYQPIENYGVIGDLNTVALVGMDGSIDFMSFPHFDSPTIFARLLDHDKGGHFRIAPILNHPQHRQLYLPDTNVLLTRFLSDDGVAEISDCMPIQEMGHAHDVIRRVKTVRGEIRFRMICQPRFDYARVSHRVEHCDGYIIFVSDSRPALALRLRSSVPARIENGAAIAEFTLKAGESAAFVLEQIMEGDSQSPSKSPDYVSTAFKETVNFWRRWVSHSRYQGRWRETVNRSALTLKLLTSEPYGSIVAAPTFGLPEQIGGGRNWDYRYSWIRDSSFTLYALMRLGYTQEATAFMRWLEQRCQHLRPDGSLQLMYRIDGGIDLPEEILSHFEGYQQSAPVRIGNHAQRQLQLDIYGEMMDSIYIYNKYGEPISYDLWTHLVALINWVSEHWREPDEGIWEVRGGRHEFLLSRLMCWVAIDRGLRLAQTRSFPAPNVEWQRTRDEIYHDIFTNFWNPERKTFVQYKGGDSVDAATLLMPLVKFIGPTDPRWASTMRAIEEDLVSDSLVFRYKIGPEPLDGLKGTEGTFSACSFWYVECLARMGQLDQARFIFEKTLGYANHLGLFSEEISPSGQHTGNFPQAFTHLTLISAAFDLDRRLSVLGRRD
jgi:GH15 family glucan-1,4-alpha-glucosidase